MRTFVSYSCTAVIGISVLFASCRKTPPSSTETSAQSSPANLDACTLITNDEVAQIQGSSIKETKSSAEANRGFRVAQCFYTATEFSKSVVLSVTQRDPESPGKQTPKEFWIKTFREGGAEKEPEREGKKVEPPKKIEGAGDEAYWTGMGSGAALYVLKNDIFIRISIGGSDDEEMKLKKTKALAFKALERL